MIRRFARPYARAIMDAAGSPEKAAALRDELAIFAKALASSQELRDLYASPTDEEARLNVTRQLATKMQASELASRTLAVLVRNHRINDIDAIVEALTAYVNTALGVAVAEVRAAKALTGEEAQELVDTLSKRVGKKVELDVKTDPELLGGFVVKIGSEIWDASVAGKINKFRESLV